VLLVEYRVEEVDHSTLALFKTGTSLTTTFIQAIEDDEARSLGSKGASSEFFEY
jgi:hypothetical protein